MTKPEILVLSLIIALILFVGLTYFFHGSKIEKKAREDKKKAKIEAKKVENSVVEQKEQEQQPVPVGIIKPEVKKVASKETGTKKEEYDLAPFREKPQEAKTETKQEVGDVKDEIKSLSPEMKKVLMSDLLKPRF